jgi:hypothetical protein
MIKVRKQQSAGGSKKGSKQSNYTTMTGVTGVTGITGWMTMLCTGAGAVKAKNKNIVAVKEES